MEGGRGMEGEREGASEGGMRDGGREGDGWREGGREGGKEGIKGESGVKDAHFCNGDSSSLCHGHVEISGGLSEHKVSASVRLPCLDEGVVSSDGLLHNIVTTIEHPVLLASALNFHMVLVVKFDRFSLVYERSKPGGCVKCGDPCSSSPDTLHKGTLEEVQSLQDHKVRPLLLAQYRKSCD